jgi:hypothetical protein
MSKVNAHGGYWVVEGAPSVRVDNAEHEIDIEEMIDDTTDSGSGGAAEGLPCIYKVQSLSMSVAEDDVAYPEALGLTQGARLTIFAKRGALAQWDKVANTIVKTLRKINDNNGKARRVNVVCEYGTYSRNVAAPAGFEAA